MSKPCPKCGGFPPEARERGYFGVICPHGKARSVNRLWAIILKLVGVL